jgi:hypothetical protein
VGVSIMRCETPRFGIALGGDLRPNFRLSIPTIGGLGSRAWLSCT